MHGRGRLHYTVALTLAGIIVLAMLGQRAFCLRIRQRRQANRGEGAGLGVISGPEDGVYP